MLTRKRKISEKSEKEQVKAAEAPNEAVSIVFKDGPMRNDVLDDKIHSIPCRIEYNGPAKVSTYFVREKLGDDTELATFRGRILNGVRQQLPEGYRLYTAVEKEEKDNNRVFEVTGSAGTFMRWEYDRSANYQSPLAQAISYVSAADAFADDDDDATKERKLAWTPEAALIMIANHPGTVLLLLLCTHYQDLIYGEPISVAVGVGSAVIASLLGVFNYYARCKIFECCDNKWVKANDAGLRHAMRTRLYGQHLAKETIITAAVSHWNNPAPKKALVMSFHGWTGCGKNYLASMIGENLFTKGMKSNFVHLYVSTLHFSDPQNIPHYQAQLRTWIQGNVSLCERSLFVFDEVDKMPAKMLDAIKPFIDHYEYLEGVDFRKSIFIFLSNSGSNEIAQKVFQHYTDGKIRETLTLKEVEDAVIASAFNTEGGLKMSELISAHLIDHFVPFLPLERRHILLCIRDYMLNHNYTATNDRITAIADSLQYFPKPNPIYSASGCKRVAQKTELHMSAEREKERLRFEGYSGDDDDEL